MAEANKNDWTIEPLDNQPVGHNLEELTLNVS
jgi:hypothetical protein